MLVLLNNSLYFEEILLSFSEGLNDLNIPHDVRQQVSDEEDVYVTFTTHELFRPLPPRYISYNIEQLTTDKQWSPEFFHRLRKAQFVIDYSKENIQILQKHGIQAIFIPIAYGSCMNYHVDRSSDFKYKFGFIGAMNDYRKEKLAPILADTFVSNNCWKNEKKKIFSQFKYGLNFHYYKGNTILEVQRILPLIANKILVFSERSSDSFYDNLLKDMVTFIDDVTEIQDYTMDEYNGIVEERYKKLIIEFKYANFIPPNLFQE